LLKGGDVTDLNGEPGEFFRTYKGLRHGDPLSPLLFNLVADALTMMLKKGCRAGMINGVILELIEGGLTHLQYADDTMIFIEADRQSIANVKFLLYCFENMSGLKINYQKSEVIGIGISEIECATVANLLNCKRGCMLMKYLGIPVSDRMLYAANLIEVRIKVEKRLPTWQGRLLSSGGKSILT
jgi:hypothetical protein